MELYIIKYSSWRTSICKTSLVRIQLHKKPVRIQSYSEELKTCFSFTWNFEGFNYLAFIENWMWRSSQSHLIEAVRRGIRMV